MSDSAWGPSAAGARIKAARSERGLDLGVLAAQLKVPTSRLEALEAGRWQDLPDGPYARGLATAVCRVLQIDAEPVLQAMPGASADALERVTAGLNQPFREGGAPPSWARWAGAAVVVVLVALAAALWFWPDAGWTELAGDAVVATPSEEWAPVVTTPASETLAQPVASAGSTVPVTIASASGGPASVAPLAAPAVAPVLAPVAAPIASAAPAPGQPASAPVAAPGPGMLRIEAREATWVSVMDAKGQRLTSRLLQPGEVLTLNPEAMPVRLTLGNAPGVRLAWRGKDQDLSAYAQARVARLELP